MREELQLNIGDDGKVILPQPADLSKKEKEDGMGAYLMMFAAMGGGLPLPLINLLASFIYYQINKKKSRYTAFHSFQSLITQLPISVVNGVLLFWFIRLAMHQEPDFPRNFLVYLAFVVIWNILYLVLSIRACICAKKGQLYYMFLFGGVAFNKFYGENAKDMNYLDTVAVNSPPPGY